MSVSILVTGANGQLGKELQLQAGEHPDFQFHFYGSSLLDLSSQFSIESIVSNTPFDYVINCGAYTQVDKAEDETNKAYEINGTALKYLSAACNNIGSTLIHISTDYVYDSINGRPIIETDPSNPKSTYAKSKLIGEEYIQQLCQKWIIIRTSWVYSSFGHNFVKTMLRLGNSRDKLSIVNDQIGTPTYASDIAEVILNFVMKMENRDVMSSLHNEIYNFSNQGITSWDAFAKKIFDLSDIDCEVKGITSEEYGAKAPRPSWSVLSKEKIESTLGIEIREWESALRDCLDRLKSKA